MTANKSPSIFPLLAPQKNQLIASTLLTILATGMGLVPFIVVYLIATALINPPIDQVYIWKLIIFSFIVFVVRWSLLWITGVISHIAAYKILYDLRIKLSEKLSTLALGYLNFRTTGTLQKVMNEDVEYLELTIVHGIPEGIGLITTFLATSIYLFTVNWRMALAALGALPITFLSQFLLFKDLQPITEKFFSLKDVMNSNIIEYVQGMPVIKAFTQTTESFTKLKDSINEYQEFQVFWTKISLFH